MRGFLRPRTVVPLLLGVALLAGLLAFGGAPRVLARVAAFRPRYLLAFFLLMVAYEAVRCLQWSYLLGALGLRVPPRVGVFSYMVGEVTKTLPVGNFVPNYVLRRTHGTDFGLASAATLLIALLEVVVALVGVVAFGIAGWPWLRPLIVAGAIVCALAGWAAVRWGRAPAAHAPASRAPAWMRGMRRWRWARRAIRELRQLRRGQAALARPRVLALTTALTTAYLALGGLAFYVVVLGLGLGQLSLAETLAVYAVSLAVADILPLPMDFGSIEISGAGALLALGLARSDAASLMLLSRLLALAATLAIALVTCLALWRELRATMCAPAEARPSPADASPDTPRASPIAVGRPIAGPSARPSAGEPAGGDHG